MSGDTDVGDLPHGLYLSVTSMVCTWHVYLRSSLKETLHQEPQGLLRPRSFLLNSPCDEDGQHLGNGSLRVGRGLYCEASGHPTVPLVPDCLF